MVGTFMSSMAADEMNVNFKLARRVELHAGPCNVGCQGLAIFQSGHPLFAVHDIRHGADVGAITGDDRPLRVLLVKGIAGILRIGIAVIRIQAPAQDRERTVFFRSFLPVILSTMPEMVMDGLMSAAEPVYPRSLSSSET